MLKMLFVLFVGLKLAEVIDWHWFFVVLPALLLFVQTVLMDTFLDLLKKRHLWAIGLAKWLWS